MMKKTMITSCRLLVLVLLFTCLDNGSQVMAFSSSVAMTDHLHYSKSFLNGVNNDNRQRGRRTNNNNQQAQRKNNNNSNYNDDPFGDTHDPFGDYSDDENLSYDYNSYQNDNDDDEDDGDFAYHFYDDDDSNNDFYNNNNQKNQNNRKRREEQKQQQSSSSSSSRAYNENREFETSSSTQQVQQKAHFFSKKSLLDPSFVYSDGSGGGGKVLQEKLCEEAGIVKPSRIQALAWPLLVKGEDAIIADQTGSGKTLAYLLPLLQRSLSGVDLEKKKAAPRILILAPTAELADQIELVCCSKFAHRFSTAVITAQGKYATDIYNQIRMLRTKSFHVLISTPGRIATILRSKSSGGLDLTHVQSVVLDEVDVLLMDDTFGPQLRTIGSALTPSSSNNNKNHSNDSRSNKEKTQFVFVTATLPDTVVDSVKAEFDGVQLVKGPGLHRVAPTVKERLIDVSVSDNRNLNLGFEKKARELQLALRQTSCRRTLVFCNTVESCRKVENLLKRKDRNFRLTHVSSYHNAMSPEARRKSIASFSHGLTNKEKQPRRKASNSSRRGDGHDDDDNVNYVLICTDRAARGVDFDESPVDHVILFDFPKDPAEYVRRVGRTARAGRSGKTTVFAYGWQLPIARKIMGFSKLDTISSTFSDNQKDKSDDDEYTAKERQKQQQQQKQKQKRKNNNKNKMIRNNIQDGKTWS